MNNSLHIGKVFGISLRLHYSWFVIFVLVTLSQAMNLITSDLPLWQGVLGGVITALLFFGSVVAHEITHSLLARRYGIPVHSITLFIFGGVAQITREADHPGDELLIAAGGPASSFAIAGIFYTARVLLGQPENTAATVSLGWLAFINLMLGVFNLVPGFPLDGGRVLRAILWRSRGDYKTATRTASLTGRGVGYLFILAGMAMAFGFQFWIFQGWVSGLWLALIGWFLESAARASYRQVSLREALLGLRVSQVMTTDCVAVPASTSIGELVRGHVLSSGRRCFLVTADSRLEGLISVNNIRAVPKARWETTTAGQAMTPATEIKTARSDEDAFSVLSRMEEGQLEYVPVADAGRIIGLVSRDTLRRLMRTRAELGA